MNEIMEILSPILGDKIAAAVIAHRKAKKAPLTAYAAELQVKEYIKTGNPIAAAEMQILRNWVAIKSSWYFNEIAREQKTAEALKNPWDAFGTPSRREPSPKPPEPINHEMIAKLRMAGVRT